MFHHTRNAKTPIGFDTYDALLRMKLLEIFINMSIYRIDSSCYRQRVVSFISSKK